MSKRRVSRWDRRLRPRSRLVDRAGGERGMRGQFRLCQTTLKAGGDTGSQRFLRFGG